MPQAVVSCPCSTCNGAHIPLSTRENHLARDLRIAPTTAPVVRLTRKVFGAGKSAQAPSTIRKRQPVRPKHVQVSASGSELDPSRPSPEAFITRALPPVEAIEEFTNFGSGGDVNVDDVEMHQRDSDNGKLWFQPVSTQGSYAFSSSYHHLRAIASSVPTAHSNHVIHVYVSVPRHITYPYTIGYIFATSIHAGTTSVFDCRAAPTPTCPYTSFISVIPTSDSRDDAGSRRTWTAGYAVLCDGSSGRDGQGWASCQR